MIPFSETLSRKAEAKQYVDTVIDQMSMADSDIKSAIKNNIADLIHYCATYQYLGKSFQFSASPQLEKSVNEILDKLKRDIFNSIYMRCEYVNDLALAKEKKENTNIFLLAFLGIEIAGATLDMRISNYINLMRSEVEAYIAAGISKGLSAAHILVEYLSNLKSPYTSPLLKEAFKQKGFLAERIRNKGVTLGVGKYTSAFNNLIRLEQQSIFHAYNNTLNNIWLIDNNVVGWYTVRGSDYPCSICDDNVGVFHPKEYFFWGYHLRCCCIMIPVLLSDIISKE